MMAEVRWVVVVVEVVVDGMYPRTIPFLLGDNNTGTPLQYPCKVVQYKSFVPLLFWRATNRDPDQAIL